ncbi:MAG: tRNA uridine-5-carboxymethylaminomethyl(34) synthesis GTPase MnmE [Candidatus Omnitrophica bacterium]|nr:tRNA uridine-5-carboxymethylaminomethyl(34) synthesis GTPase MnmE [Candidatus Omnitrophota bacterium]
MHKYNIDDTIAAISTPVGEGGIGIVRLSGKDALAIVDKIFFSERKIKPSDFKSYTIHYGLIKNGGEVIDEVILTVMCAPRSYTKEDVVEINCHGGIVALRDVLDLVLVNGARLADPGEFTKRAFLNGRIDLAQAEAVLDIIRAKTDSALKIGLGQLKGALSAELNKIRDVLLDILTQLEASIDFPEDANDTMDFLIVCVGLRECDGRLKAMLVSSKRGRIFREGIHAVICGKPNVGKSSLLNALLKHERSIVTPVAGTTRDAIEEIIDIKGIPVRIVDTAGMLNPRGLVEKKAVQRSKKLIAQADIVVILFDGSRKLSAQDWDIIRSLKGKQAIAIINKIDLKQKIEKEKIVKQFVHTISLSAKKARNINLLEDKIVELVYKGKVIGPESVVVGNLRHVSCLREAQILIAQAVGSVDNKASIELIAQDVKDSLGYLDELLGKKFSEDLLDKIFSRFCIGK